MAQKVTYKANSQEDVLALVKKMRDAHSEEAIDLASDLMYLGLFNIKNSIIESAISVMRDKKNDKAVKLFVCMASGFDKNFVSEFIDDACHHAIGGFDTEDEDSVGGWSQREIDLLVEKRNW